MVYLNLERFTGQQNPDGSRRIKTIQELRHKMKQEDTVKFIKSQRLRWAAHVMRMEKTRNTRKITEWTTYKTRPVGRHRLR
jgi:NADH:ubiquinone oxidoreductase subunit E